MSEELKKKMEETAKAAEKMTEADQSYIAGWLSGVIEMAKLRKSA